MRVDPRAPPEAVRASRWRGPGSLSALTRRSCRFSDEGADPCTAETVLTGESETSHSFTGCSTALVISTLSSSACNRTR